MSRTKDRYSASVEKKCGRGELFSVDQFATTKAAMKSCHAYKRGMHQGRYPL